MLRPPNKRAPLSAGSYPKKRYFFPPTSPLCVLVFSHQQLSQYAKIDLPNSLVVGIITPARRRDQRCVANLPPATARTY